MTRRETVLVIGLAAAGLGLALAGQPRLLQAELPVQMPTILAAGAIAAAAHHVYRWRQLHVEPTLLDSPDTERDVDVPGDEVDDLLRQVPAITSSAGDRRALKARQNLRDVAVDVLVAYRDLTEAEARTQLDTGEWTDDPLAAEFFAKLDGTAAPISESVTESMRDSSPFERRARRAVAALATVAEEGHQA